MCIVVAVVLCSCVLRRDFVVFVRRELWFERFLVAKLEKQVCNIVFNGEAACSVYMARCIVPLEVDASKLGTFQVLRDLIVFLEDFT